MANNKGGKRTEKSVFLTLQTFPVFKKIKTLRLQTTAMSQRLSFEQYEFEYNSIKNLIKHNNNNKQMLRKCAIL